MSAHEKTVVRAVARFASGPLSPTVMRSTLTDLAHLAGVGETAGVELVLAEWTRAIDVLVTGEVAP